MVKVIRYLSHIHDKYDLRVSNDRIFKLKKILNSRIDCFIKYYDFDILSDLDKEDEESEKSDCDDSPLFK